MEGKQWKDPKEVVAPGMLPGETDDQYLERMGKKPTPMTEEEIERMIAQGKAVEEYNEAEKEEKEKREENK